MARNLKPKHKASRRFGENVAETVKSPLLKRNYPPGVHGPKKVFNKVSEYGRQLNEKQKAKAIYGILERQFSLFFKRASAMSGDAGVNLLTMLECRLDNVVFRSGLAPTRRLARQLVSHGHFTVDGKNTNIPSYIVRPGQQIKVKQTKTKKAWWVKVLENSDKIQSAGWLSVDAKELSISVNSLPQGNELPQNIQPQLIVEFYSR